MNYGDGRRRILYDIPRGIDSMSWEKNLDKNMNFNKGHSVHGLALPLCIHLGITDIFVIGWDGLVPDVKNTHFYDNGRADRSEYGSTAIVECNKHTTDFLKKRWDINLFQINDNDKSLYTKIPKMSVEYCIEYCNTVVTGL